MLKAQRPYNKPRKFKFKEQSQLLEQIARGKISLEFVPSKNYPSPQIIYGLISELHSLIFKSTSNSGKELLIEIQLAIILSTIVGITPTQFFSWCYKDWDCSDGTNYLHKNVQILAKNNYSQELVSELMVIRKNTNRIPDQFLFQNLKLNTFLMSVNLLFVFYGTEISVSIDMLAIMFGRMLYLKHGKIDSVREFLKEYYNSDSHIELLVDLKLVNTIHYNTIMRN